MSTAIEGATKGFSREAVEELSHRRSEPEWLRRKRLHAWAQYEQIPMPKRTDEEWRRTDIRLLPIDDVAPFYEFGSRVFSRAELSPAIQPHVDAAGAVAGIVVQRDSTTVYYEVDPSLAAQGVIFADLDTAIREHPDLLQRYFMTDEAVPASDNKFAALHGAFWTTGTLLYVPANVEIELPFRGFSTLENPGLGTFNHVLIVADESASVTFVDYYQSDTFEHESIVDNVIELHAAEGAQVRYIQVQDWGRHVWNFTTQRGVIHQDAAIRTLNVALGSRLTKGLIASNLVGPGSSAEMLGLYFADESQHFDHQTRQNHISPYATSDLLYKGAIKDRARSVYSGVIKVWPKAHRTDAYQANRNLILDPTARADSIPNLEIGANDVRCTHGATIAQIEEEYVFYLMSRGITRTEAEKLIVDGFFDEVIERVPVESVQQTVRAAIDKKIGYTV
ncbi:MAG TPA: Fe-S cluster assembly protein SufD [Thermomicrobiales bacterium]|nr:Fe-S cluster assembly protein SufD [Thermomicrobiales bacterium]